jgi:hypothetical protein
VTVGDVLKCRSCKQPIVNVAVYLGETYDGVEKEWPFHEHCADQAWPLYEIRRVDVTEDARAAIDWPQVLVDTCAGFIGAKYPIQRRVQTDEDR